MSASSGANGSTEHGPRAVAVGIDLIEHERLIETYERFGDRFLRRVFTEREIAEAEGHITRLMGRFVAKEATAKALGTGIGAVAWREIEIIRTSGGKPELRLHGAAAATAAAQGWVAFDLSISDTHRHTIAMVVALRG
jgi:holo-[acyl-carrier protein] synthase